MYRLLKLSYWTTNKQRLLTTSVQSAQTFQSHQTCSFCKTNFQNVFDRGAARNYASTPKNNPVITTKKKKRVRRTKQFIELLQVTSESATETKTPITNLNAKNISILTQTKLKSIKKPQNSHLASNFSSYSKEPSLDKKFIQTLNPEFSTELLQEEDDAFQDPKSMNPSALLEDPYIQNGIIEELSQTEKEVTKVSKKSANKKKKELQSAENAAKSQAIEIKAREETLSRVLLAYCDLCVAHDKTGRGLQALHFYLNRAKRYPTTAPKVLDVKIYNCLIEGFAGKANYSKILEVFQLMKREQIRPDIQSYVGVFECLGRLPENDIKQLVDVHLKELRSSGFQINDLMDHGKFINDRREVVLTALKRIDPTFVPKYTTPQIQYDCNLLRSLNHRAQLNLFEKSEEIFLNSNINQLDHDFFENLKHKSCKEIRNHQLHSNIMTLLNQKTDTVNLGHNVLSNTNTYHPLSISIPNFEGIQTGLSGIKDYLKEFIKSPGQIKKMVNLVPFRKESSFKVTELQEKARKQMEVEANGFITVDSIEKQSEPTEIVNHFRQKIKDTQKHWENVIKFCISRDLHALNAQNQATGGARGSPSLNECLHAVPIDELTQIVLQEVRRLAEGSETYSPTLSQLYREIGQIVHSRYQVRLKKRTGVLDKVDRIYEKYCEWYANYYTGEFREGERMINPRQYWQALVYNDQNGPTLDNEDRVWPYTLIVAVGKFLYNIIMKDLKVDVNAIKLKSKNCKLLPAFYSLYRSQGHVIKEEVKAHPVVSRLFRGAAMPKIVFNANALPMQCPPKPWADFNTGGYLVVNTSMLRLPPQATQQIQRIINSPPALLYPSFDSLNQLASVSWKVNESILDTVLHLFREGGNAKLGVAPPPDSLQYPPPAPATASKTEKFQAFRQRLLVRRRKAEMYSLWCDALYRLSLANHFRNQAFWLPHNMDFRGRVYPVPPHLTHLGADLARALLVFADKKPLGEDGLRWLKLHVVNLLGTKKRQSIEERLEYADDMLSEILDSADNPLNGRMWWAQSEEPWQTLACCKEITNAIRSSDPSKYETNYPIHQDGSCNGLQHYAALGRDAAGAKSVNLAPSDYPQDVYSAVATLVEAERQKDAEAGLKIAQVLDGFVKRKVIKQTVMTTVYGVTRFGARLQIAKQLKDIDDFPKESVWQASSYLTTKTFESLRSMFTSTREIQDWFTECARYISGSCLQNVEWVTPLGLPIVQPYNRYRKIDNLNSSKNRIAEHFATDMFERPNVMKQKNAFPPNFIHSLDSSHMMLTSINCERAGITFVSVHDCFWTHPSTVSIMNKICREQFVALHSEPILESLSEFLCQKYTKDDRLKDLNDHAAKPTSNKILRQVPTTGDFNLESVLNSVYFFS